MNKIPEPFSLCNEPAPTPDRKRGFRVPFGLRDGRVWAPGEVAKGKGCGCVCPGCGQRLVAKAQESRRRRPHFAHLTATDCEIGRESGIHMRAKQVIQDRRQVLLPGWTFDPLEMPNPPTACDDEGRPYEGKRVDFPAREAELQVVRQEQHMGAYQPDVLAMDDAGELLIEIRVTHAVDARKAELVQGDGRRMIEIDLSRMDRDLHHDAPAFDKAVLFDPANRTWVSCPEAVAQWQQAKEELDREVAERNKSLAEQRDAAAKAQQTCAEADVRDAKDRAGRKAFMRDQQRRKVRKQLALLTELTDPKRVGKLLKQYQESAEARVSELLESATPEVRSICLRAHPDAWIYGVDPALWQLLAFEQFVGKSKPGARFNQRDVARWVRQTFPYERELYQLFIAQYAHRADARRAGFNKRRLSHWAFTPEENDAIPNFYDPINEFVDRMEFIGAVRKLASPIGECEVRESTIVELNRRVS